MHKLQRVSQLQMEKGIEVAAVSGRECKEKGIGKVE